MPIPCLHKGQVIEAIAVRIANISDNISRHIVQRAFESIDEE
jgi:hypothetical protein